MREHLKSALRRQTAIYELVRRRRARRQESQYVRRRDRYANDAGPVFAPPGYLERSAWLLKQRWRGARAVKNRPGDVRLFAAIADVPGGPRFVNALASTFDASIFDWGRYRSSNEDAFRSDLSWRSRLQSDVVEAFRDADRERPVDLVFVYGSHLEFERATLEALRSMGAPVALVSLDDKHLFDERTDLGYPNGQRPLIGAADVHVTNSRECVRWYLASRAPVYYMPQGIDTELFRTLGLPIDIDVSFMGQRYGFRAHFIEALEESGIDVTCFGPGWGTCVVSEEEKVEIYNRSRINLGLGGVAYSSEVTCIKGRDLEVPAAGGFYLTTYDAELADLFDIGREIVCYRNEIDCVELIRYYLEHEDERRAIARAGRERCVLEHTWQARLQGLLRWLGILDQPRT